MAHYPEPSRIVIPFFLSLSSHFSARGDVNGGIRLGTSGTIPGSGFYLSVPPAPRRGAAIQINFIPNPEQYLLPPASSSSALHSPRRTTKDFAFSTGYGSVATYVCIVLIFPAAALPRIQCQCFPPSLPPGAASHSVLQHSLTSHAPRPAPRRASSTISISADACPVPPRPALRALRCAS